MFTVLHKILILTCLHSSPSKKRETKSAKSFTFRTKTYVASLICLSMLLQICCSFRDHEGLFYLKVCFQHKEVVVFLYTHVTSIVVIYIKTYTENDVRTCTRCRYCFVHWRNTCDPFSLSRLKVSSYRLSLSKAMMIQSALRVCHCLNTKWLTRSSLLFNHLYV